MLYRKTAALLIMLSLSAPSTFAGFQGAPPVKAKPVVDLKPFLKGDGKTAAQQAPETVSSAGAEIERRYQEYNQGATTGPMGYFRYRTLGHSVEWAATKMSMRCGLQHATKIVGEVANVATFGMAKPLFNFISSKTGCAAAHRNYLISVVVRKRVQNDREFLAHAGQLEKDIGKYTAAVVEKRHKPRLERDMKRIESLNRATNRALASDANI